MSDTLQYQGDLGNGVPFEVHTAKSFSNRAELMIKVGGKEFITASIDVKGSGAIECKTIKSKAVMIQPQGNPGRNSIDDLEEVSQPQLD